MDDYLSIPAKLRFQDLVTWKRFDKVAPFCTQQNSIPSQVWNAARTLMTLPGIDNIFLATVKLTVTHMSQICRLVIRASYKRFYA